MHRLLLILVLLLVVARLHAAPFELEDIRVEGLQRLELGRVLRALDLEVGDRVGEYRLGEATKALFDTGVFDDIKIYRDGNILIARVQERPAISRIEISGNEAVETEALMEGLKGLGLAEGEVFQRAALERIRLELLRLYATQGRYGALIETETQPLPENRLGLDIRITEGQAATIRHINLVGNEAFSDAELKELFELETTSFWSFLGDSDRYAREKLNGDLERLRSHYLDRGYIRFSVDSTQVSLSPNRKDVYITINVSEGDQYRFGDFELAGELKLPEARLREQVELIPGTTFSRRQMVRSADGLSRVLGDEGFLQANVNPVPEIDEEARTVDIRFFVDPARRIYVRRINFRGNTTSADEVLRREMRQMEAGLASTEDIENSRSRLERLGFFSEVNLQTDPVPGTPDQVDLEYSVVEQLSGNLSASVGFSQSSGIILAVGVSQKNFLGTGKNVSFNINNSDIDTEYSFSYTDPYYTVDGVSRGFDLFLREQNFEENDLTDFNIDAFGGSVSFGYPISEYRRLNFALGYENLTLKLGNPNLIPLEISDFAGANGRSFDQFKFTTSWSDNHLNKGILATSGYSQSVSLELGIPGSDLEYFKLRYRGQRFFPINEEESWVLSLKTELGYGGAGRDTGELPFFKNFYAGGFGSVRGFKNNSLGPRSESGGPGGEDPLGGNVLVSGSAELIFPIPGLEASSGLRTLFFVDAGSVFDTDCRAGNDLCNEGVRLDSLSASAGVGLSWLTFIGPMSFSLAKPLKEQERDETETFQFALGRSF